MYILDLLLDRITLTAYVDAVYCYRPSSVVCRSVCLSICHTSEPCENGLTDRDAVWVEDSDGPREPCIRWGPDISSEDAILGTRRAHCKYRDFLPWAVQERQNRSICRLDCGLGWAEGTTSSVVFTRWRQCAHMGRHMGITWRIRLNRRLQRRCGFMSNYFDHLLLLLLLSFTRPNNKRWTSIGLQLN